MKTRKAQDSDIARLAELLLQVNDVHARQRPDLFVTGGRKYTDDELKEIIKNDETPVFVADDDSGKVLGYAFCMFVNHSKGHALRDIKTLYIDDICVDSAARGKKIGTQLYNHVVEYARSAGCHNVTLNVWTCNPGAMAFYEKMGLKPQKIGMEKLL